jgi:hypothetical protein
LSAEAPTLRIRFGSSHSTTFGVTTPAFDRNASSTIARVASGASATSSWQKR